ncbi:MULTISPECIES: hypothetical protein [Vibrio harveyi group]|uniref:Uncharacterized protein n=1 Tax=Vibrio owensii CAIM 1854 = LMG 25443 TaxID=1229493 RepID=A0A0C1VTE6_9VIBR|nr:hypothetical protein [Vibrio owensii]KIF53178.1 hypothetical protein H735_09590 [Vibrio owensii CAIM 1854 = LMG 25443]
MIDFSKKNKLTNYMHKSMVVGSIVSLVMLFGMQKTISHYAMEEYKIFLELSANSQMNTELLNHYRTCLQSVFNTKGECLTQAITITEKKFPQENVSDILIAVEPYTEYKKPTLYEVLIDTFTLKYL